MGGGFSQQDFEDAISTSALIRPVTDPTKDSSDSECQVAWFRPAHFAPGGSGRPPFNGPPSAEVTAKLCHDGLWKYLDELKSGSGKGKVFYF